MKKISLLIIATLLLSTGCKQNQQNLAIEFQDPVQLEDHYTITLEESLFAKSFSPIAGENDANYGYGATEGKVYAILKAVGQNQSTEKSVDFRKVKFSVTTPKGESYPGEIAVTKENGTLGEKVDTEIASSETRTIYMVAAIPTDSVKQEGMFTFHFGNNDKNFELSVSPQITLTPIDTDSTIEGESVDVKVISADWKKEIIPSKAKPNSNYLQLEHTKNETFLDVHLQVTNKSEKPIAYLNGIVELQLIEDSLISRELEYLMEKPGGHDFLEEPKELKPKDSYSYRFLLILKDNQLDGDKKVKISVDHHSYTIDLPTT